MQKQGRQLVPAPQKRGLHFEDRTCRPCLYGNRSLLKWVLSALLPPGPRAAAWLFSTCVTQREGILGRGTQRMSQLNGAFAKRAPHPRSILAAIIRWRRSPANACFKQRHL